MLGLDTTKLLEVAAVAMLILLPRRQAIFDKLKAMVGWNTPTAATDANSVASAYQLLAKYLDAETAQTVRRQVADRFLGADAVATPAAAGEVKP